MRARILSVTPVVEPQRVRVVQATGTPVSESPGNAHTILSILTHGRLPAPGRFTSHFEVKEQRRTRGGPAFSQVVRYQHLDYLRRLLDRQSIRRLRTEIRGMPELVSQRREVSLDPSMRKVYQDLRTSALESISLTERVSTAAAMVRLIRLRQLLEHPPIVGVSAQGPKVQELDALLDEVLSNPTAKAIVWCAFVPAVVALAERYAEYGARSVYEGTSVGELRRIEASFDTDSTRVIVATPKKAGTGLDFLARARTSIYLSRPYSYVEDRQSRNRVIRRTAAEPKTEVERIKASPALVIYLHSPGTVDDLVEVAHARKARLVDAATPNMEIDVEMSRAEITGLV